VVARDVLTLVLVPLELDGGVLELGELVDVLGLALGARLEGQFVEGAQQGERPPLGDLDVLVGDADGGVDQDPLFHRTAHRLGGHLLAVDAHGEVVEVEGRFEGELLGDGQAFPGLEGDVVAAPGEGEERQGEEGQAEDQAFGGVHRVN